MNEAVQRYVQHTEALRKLSEYGVDPNSFIFSDVNETLNVPETMPDFRSVGGEVQEDLEVVKFLVPEIQKPTNIKLPNGTASDLRYDWKVVQEDLEVGGADISEAHELTETVEFQKPTAVSKPFSSLPIPPFKPEHLLIERELELPSPIPPLPLSLNLGFALQRQNREFIKKVSYLSLPKKPCADEVLTVPKKAEFVEKKLNPRDVDDREAFIPDFKFPELGSPGKLQKRNWKRDMRMQLPMRSLTRGVMVIFDNLHI